VIQIPSTSFYQYQHIDTFLTAFETHSPPWSARINYRGKTNVYVYNTCSVVYNLFTFRVVFKLLPEFLENIPDFEHKETLIRIIYLNGRNEWDLVRELTVVSIMKFKNSPDLSHIDLAGDQDYLMEKLNYLQNFTVVRYCIESCPRNKSFISGSNFYFKWLNGEVVLYYNRVCTVCKKERVFDYIFQHKPMIIYIVSGEVIEGTEILSQSRHGTDFPFGCSSCLQPERGQCRS
jgi:hypothetical protein